MDGPQPAFAAAWVEHFAPDLHAPELTNEHLLQPEVAETIDPIVLASGFEIDKTFKFTDWVEGGDYCPIPQTQTPDLPVFPADPVPDLSKSSFQPCVEIVHIASHTSAPAVPVPGHRQTSPPMTFVNCSPGQLEKSTRPPAKSIRRSVEPASRRTRSGTTTVGSVSGQNDPLGASVSASCSVPAIDPQVPAWNDPLGQSAIVPVDFAQFAGRNDPPYAFELAPVCSDHPVPVAHAASVPVDLLEAAREHCVLAYHGLENTKFTLEGIESFAGAGHTDHLQFSSLEEASSAHLSDARPHDDDRTMPRDTRLKKVYVWLLCVALHSVQYAVDVSETARGLSLPNGFKTAMKQGSVVELCAWQMLVSIRNPFHFIVTSHSLSLARNGSSNGILPIPLALPAASSTSRPSWTASTRL